MRPIGPRTTVQSSFVDPSKQMPHLARPAEALRRFAARPRPARAGRLPRLLVLSLLATSVPFATVAQEPPDPPVRAVTSDDGNEELSGSGADGYAPEEEQAWKGLLGVPEPDRLHAGLWTLHLYRRHDGLSAHHLLGISWRGFYGATFINSHGARTFGLGLTRTMARAERRDAGVSVGYRLGMLAGYDGQLHDLAERWPVIPAAELNLGLRYRGVGAQLTWSWLVASVGGFVPLGD